MTVVLYVNLLNVILNVNILYYMLPQLTKKKKENLATKHLEDKAQMVTIC